MFQLTQDLWFNSKSGYIDDKLKHIRQQQKSVIDHPNLSKDSNNNIHENDEVVDESESRYILFLLKITVVTEESKPLMTEKLIKTQKYRLNMLKNSELDLLENFPFFFSNPDLVRRVLIIFAWNFDLSHIFMIYMLR